MMLIARFIRSEKDSDEVYGAPRITAELAERYQVSVNRKTVAKRMRLMGIKGMSPRAFVPVTTIQAKRKSSLPDLVRRMCDTGELNRVWMSDITYLRTGEGWLYLCVVRDGHSRRIPGWAMDGVLRYISGRTGPADGVYVAR
nr:MULTISPECIES: IS3 family transposase [unclassified Corynebacterium]MDK8468309.1 IS3 family transposase [Corynebacterium sp. MSK130]